MKEKTSDAFDGCQPFSFFSGEKEELQDDGFEIFFAKPARIGRHC